MYVAVRALAVVARVGDAHGVMVRGLMVCIAVALWLLAACSSSDSTPAQRKPTGDTHDPVEVCERVGDVCRLDGARLGVCNQPPAGASPQACAGRDPCFLCMSQH